MFFSKLAEEHKVSYVTSEKIFGDFQCLLETTLSKYAKQAQQAGKIFSTHDPTNSHRRFGNEFPGCLLKQGKSTYKREQFAIGNLPYVKPEEHSLANPRSLSFQYRPICKVIKSLPQVAELSTSPTPDQTRDDRSANTKNCRLVTTIKLCICCTFCCIRRSWTSRIP